MNNKFKKSVLQNLCQGVKNVHTVDEGEVLDTQVLFDGSIMAQVKTYIPL